MSNTKQQKYADRIREQNEISLKSDRELKQIVEMGFEFPEEAPKDTKEREGL